MNTATHTEPVTISYTTSVFVNAGWRAITIEAKAVPCGRGLAEVVEVLDVDGNDPEARSASRTGARRQQYRPNSIAAREMGKRKRLSACRVFA